MENKQTFHTDRLAITVAGTPEQFDAHRIVQGHYCTIHADPTNTSNIYVGESAAKCLIPTYTLTPDASLQVACDNCSDIWVDAAVTGEIAQLAVEVANVDA